jgi:hypothetical protein
LNSQTLHERVTAWVKGRVASILVASFKGGGPAGPGSTHHSQIFELEAGNSRQATRGRQPEAGNPTEASRGRQLEARQPEAGNPRQALELVTVGRTKLPPVPGVALTLPEAPEPAIVATSRPSAGWWLVVLVRVGWVGGSTVKVAEKWRWRGKWMAWPPLQASAARHGLAQSGS